MERSSSKKVKTNEIDIKRLSSLKRVSDLFPKGFTSETTVEDLPNESIKLIQDSSITKNIPNLVQSSLPKIPQNSITPEVVRQNTNFNDLLKHQVRNKLFKRIRPFNIITILLMLGWVITIILLNVL